MDASQETPAGAGLGSGLDTAALLRHARWAAPLAWLLAVIGLGSVWGPPLVFLGLGGGSVVLVIVLMWSSVQSLTGGAKLGFEEALGMGAPSRVEEQKRAVLRALKDLEYERGVGKISPEDYAELSARYRADAKRLIQAMDETLGPARERVESELQKRLAKAGLASDAAELEAAASEPKGEAETAQAAADAAPEPKLEAAPSDADSEPSDSESQSKSDTDSDSETETAKP